MLSPYYLPDNSVAILSPARSECPLNLGGQRQCPPVIAAVIMADVNCDGDIMTAAEDLDDGPVVFSQDLEDDQEEEGEQWVVMFPLKGVDNCLLNTLHWLSGTPKWSEKWSSKTPKQSEIWLLGSPTWSEILILKKKI